jgi:hypothetical protein
MQGTETIADPGPRVWVGCLGCYNAGALAGGWVDAIDAETFDAHSARALAMAGIDAPACGQARAEEPWCMDHEGFGGLLTGEFSPATAARVGALIADAVAEGYDVEAVAAWFDYTGAPVENVDTWADVSDDFAEAFCGEYASGADYAETLADDIGAFHVYGEAIGSDRPTDVSARWPFTCIDWQRAWRELEIGGDNYTADAPGGRVYVFRAV